MDKAQGETVFFAVNAQHERAARPSGQPGSRRGDDFLPAFAPSVEEAQEARVRTQKFIERLRLVGATPVIIGWAECDALRSSRGESSWC